MSDKVEIRTLNGHPLADVKAREALEGKQPKGDYATRDEIPSIPVQSVNKKTGAVELTAADVGAADAKETAQAFDKFSEEIEQLKENGGSGESAGGAAIIDVIALPETDIREDVFYRLLTAEFVYDQTVQNGWTCYCVESLPDIGEPVTMDQVTYTAYYNVSDGVAYGYVPDTLAPAFGVPAGWYTAEVLFSAFGYSYSGVVTGLENATTAETFYLVHSYVNYTYKDGWTKHKNIGWAGTGASAEIFNHPSNIASGFASHAEGYHSHAEGGCSHAEGESSHAEGYYSHAEGEFSHAEGSSSHAEGYASHAEGRGELIDFDLTGDANATVYTNNASLPSEIYIGMTLRMRRYGENAGNEIGVTYSSAKVVSFDTTTNTITVDRTLSDIAVTNANTIGYYAGMALSSYTHVEGNQNIAAGRSQHVQGEFNVQDPEYNKDHKNARGKYAHIVGNGTSHEARSNAHTLDWDGNAWYQGTVESAGMLLTSPNGTKYKITVADDGTLTSTAAQ